MDAGPERLLPAAEARTWECYSQVRITMRVIYLIQHALCLISTKKVITLHLCWCIYPIIVFSTHCRTYRGRIYSKLGQFEKSIEDFSLAVHLDPSSWLAFYHRGCLLREIMPHMALRDLSTSGNTHMLDITHENVQFSQFQSYSQYCETFSVLFCILCKNVTTRIHFNLKVIKST